ncbi:MAG: virB8 family protein [Steroidobacteraceae bacterium]
MRPLVQRIPARGALVMSGDMELEAYWREVAAWDFDRVAQLRRSERIAWRAAAGAGVCALLCAGALVLLVPLKQIAPFLVRVDNTTGIVDVVPSTTVPIDPGKAVTRYLLTHYITVCERFDRATAESDYAECGAFNSAKRNEQWYALWKPTNPASPLNRHKDGSTVEARVVAVSFLGQAGGADLAQVRYLERLRRSGSSSTIEVSHWIATLEYAYTKPSSNIRLRSLNPLGFKILDFEAEPEVSAPSANEGSVGPTAARGGSSRISGSRR